MAFSGVVASRRFERDYLDFQRKYSDLETNLREFILFRREHRLPNDRFGQKDGPLQGTRCRYCHLIHGKAILIYQLGENHLRLVSMEEHKVIETGSGRSRMRQYAQTLTSADYQPFDIKHPGRDKPMQDYVPRASEQEATVTQSETAQRPEAEPEVAEPEVARGLQQPVSEATPLDAPTKNEEPADESLWAEHTVRYLTDRQMLWRPRPSRDVIVIHLDQELIVPRGDVLVIDLGLARVRHLTTAQLQVQFEEAERKTTDLTEAVKAVVIPTVEAEMFPSEPVSDPLPDPMPRPAKPRPAVRTQMRASRPTNGKVGAQLGRVLVTLAQLKRIHPKVDTVLLKKYLPERDALSISPVLNTAQLQGYVKKDGNKNKTAYYYSLTAKGRQEVNILGDWPFAAAGLKIPELFSAA